MKFCNNCHGLYKVRDYRTYTPKKTKVDIVICRNCFHNGKKLK